MSDNKSNSISLLGHSTSTDRQLVVACVLELIKADLTSNVSGTGNRDRLAEHVKHISEYADKIEEALKGK
ncbi:hypothetical protein [Vibrio cholerae]|uniref:hypothetical protein n=1 Tax=Vibrio cholerae TaxID=666 RepID=UPI0011D7FCA2|nr:hypothetical protein [Vibrio cholerae]MCX9579818.1 hypothetical protein [Vibrio cholerae]TXY57645.1 hypothetical protein FXE91_10825 [Vibrio cholerae]GHX29941.1 hypothetical protein VCSRO62_0321 [Vibrio cholerae]GHX89570.1 hypothetical protein VCSRO111_0615 [Vibrio cholerae]